MALLPLLLNKNKNDEYFTPKYAWENIIHLLPKEKTYWEAFYGNGQSLKYMKELGLKVEGGEGEDFFEHNKGDIVISNPPFSKSKQILERLKELEKPFILILPTQKLNSQYFRKLFKDEIQIIIPKKRIHFEGENIKEKSSCYFDCYYYCYKIGLEKDITWL